MTAHPSARERALQEHLNDGGLSEESFLAGWDAGIDAAYSRLLNLEAQVAGMRPTRGNQEYFTGLDDAAKTVGALKAGEP